jgi:hypothetical protein
LAAARRAVRVRGNGRELCEGSGEADWRGLAREAWEMMLTYFTTAPRAKAGPSELAQYAAEWLVLVDGLLAQFDYRDDKLAGPMISPATFIQGAKKTEENTTGVHFLLLDYDDTAPADFMRVLGQLEAECIAAFCYSTWGQPEAAQSGLVRARVGMPISRVCAKEEWRGVYGAALRKYGASGLDAKCSDPSRFYFTPGLPRGADVFASTWRASGAGAVDVDALVRDFGGASPGAAAPSAVLSTLTQPIPRDALVRLSAKLCKSDKGDDLTVGQMLRSALDGHRFAEKGQRHAAMLSVTMRLAKAFPQGDPASLAKHFEHSLGIMNDEGVDEDPTEHLIGLIESAQGKVQESAAAAHAATVVFQQTQITKAFQGQGHNRATPYTLEELTAAAQALRCDASELISRWIVQKDDSIYVLFVDPVKGPIYLPPMSRMAIETSIAQNLSPATSAGVSTDTFDERGNAVPKTLAQLIKQYGRVVKHAEMSMMAPCTYLDAMRSTIVEATAPLRVLTPEFDYEIDCWLALLAGDPNPSCPASEAPAGSKAARLCDWLATVTDLSQCAPALFLKGQAGVGKGLFADGLARLWDCDRPTSLTQAMSNFNYAIVRCPLILADERVPENFRNEPRTEELRELITTRVFELNRKHRDPISCHGALRVILAANNFGIISRGAELTPEDALALADRVILVEPNHLARDFLIKLGGPAWGETVVLGDRLAKFVHWLRVQDELGARPVVRGTRLIVPGDAGELADSLQTASHTPWSVMRWLWSFLGNPATHISMSAGKPLAALVARNDGGPVGPDGKGDVWLYKERLVECWDHYLQGERTPSRERLSGALRGIVEPERTDAGRVRLRRGKGGAVSYHRVRLEVLIQWARQNGEDASFLGEWLMRETEKIGAVGVGPSAGAARAN